MALQLRAILITGEPHLIQRVHMQAELLRLDRLYVGVDQAGLQTLLVPPLGVYTGQSDDQVEFTLHDEFCHWLRQFKRANRREQLYYVAVNYGGSAEDQPPVTVTVHRGDAFSTTPGSNPITTHPLTTKA